MRQGTRIYSILNVSMEGSCVGLRGWGGNNVSQGQNRLKVVCE